MSGAVRSMRKLKGEIMKMFAVVATGHEDIAFVRLMSNTRKDAIKLWEHWNTNTSFKDVSKIHGWKVVKYDVKLLKR
mgnify:CR=1 FL=1